MCKRDAVFSIGIKLLALKRKALRRYYKWEMLLFEAFHEY